MRNEIELVKPALHEGHKMRAKISKKWQISISKICLLIAAAIAGLSVLLGFLTLFSNSFDRYSVPMLILMGISLLAVFFYIRHMGIRNRQLAILSVLSLISAYIISILPQYVFGMELNGIIHRTFISAVILIALSIPSFGNLIFHLRGSTPKALELSKYPLILFPVVLILTAYALLIYNIFSLGIENLNWEMLKTPFIWQNWQTLAWEGDWPTWVPQQIHQPGILNYILGTLLLIALTAVISLPIGVAVGVFVTEHPKLWIAKIIRFSSSALKSMSVFILGLTAVSLVTLSSGTIFSTIMHGFFYDVNGNWHLANGSFITAAIVISLLVIPIIARSTEEGINSLPVELKEGSLALGTSGSHTLWHIIIPWAFPNIVTGLLLGCAEAAGSLATIWYIAGTGEYGVNPLSQVTSLSHFIFLCRGDISISFKNLEGIYQFSAAIIMIIITIGLSIIALISKRQLSKKFKGA
jgi:ABC-type phosphate transport system permease subunit